jgi:CDP-glucose 4,6-dehydratase
MAAQSLVLESYKNPGETFDVNVRGTVNLMEVSFKYDFIKSIVVVTTDKVYRNDDTNRKFIETDPLGGKDPYSASKVATEAVVSAWQQISKVQSGPRIVSVRAGNVIGGGDSAENRLIPDLVRSILINKEDAVIRNPENTRPWQHVLDPLAGYLLALEAALLGSTESSYNFAPDGENLSVREVTEKFISLAGLRLDIKVVDSIRPLEAFTLNLDASKAKKELNWESFWTQRESIDRSFEWWQKVLNQRVSPLQACKEEVNLFMQGSKLLNAVNNV